MAFCQFCGKELEEGKQCTCEQAQAAAQKEKTASPDLSNLLSQEKMTEAQQKMKKAASGLVSYLKAYIAAPAKAVREMTESGDLMTSVILTVIQALSVGLVIFGVLAKICGMATAAVGAAPILIRVSAPFFGSLLYGILMTVIGMALFTLVLFVLDKVQKGGQKPVRLWQASANNSVPTTALFLLAFLVSCVSIPLALGVVVLAILSWIVMGVMTAQLTAPDGESILFWGIYFVGVALIVFIGYQLFPGFILNAVGGIKLTAGEESITLNLVIDSVVSSLKTSFDLSTLLPDLMNRILRAAM